MKLDANRIRKLCRERGLTLQALLAEAGISRTAYYSLARKPSVLPASICTLAGTLGVLPSEILQEAPRVEWRTRVLLNEAKRIVAATGASFENVWHTLVLLEEPPIERLRRSLLRGRAVDLY